MDPQLLAGLSQGLILYIILAASIALHEFGHAKVADLLGDHLPRSQGRVTLNPFAHLDPIGTGLIPLVMIFWPIVTGMSLPIGLIGWGRPVQISLAEPRTRVRDEILITLAGPGMNFLIALVTAIIGGVYVRLHGGNAPDWAQQIIFINALQIVFNLIPLPPLDGSRLMRHLVGMSEEMFMRMVTVTPFILFIAVNMRWFQEILLAATVRVAHIFYFVLYHLAGYNF